MRNTGIALPAALFVLVTLGATGQARAQPFIDIGVQASTIESKIANRDDWVSVSDAGVHLGIGARRSVSEAADIGFRIELDSIDSNTLLAVRAFDYRRHVAEKFSVSAFVGAARLDLATPAWGYYLGFGVQWARLVSDWDLGLDVRIGDKLARDNLLPSDPQGGSPDNFHDVIGVSLYLSRSFGNAREDR
jgi:hypothetical protein